MSALRKENPGVEPYVSPTEIIILVPPGAVRETKASSPVTVFDDRPFWVKARANRFVDVAVFFAICLGQIALVALLMVAATYPGIVAAF